MRRSGSDKPPALSNGGAREGDSSPHARWITLQVSVIFAFVGGELLGNALHGANDWWLLGFPAFVGIAMYAGGRLAGLGKPLKRKDADDDKG